jgi:transketolase
MPTTVEQPGPIYIRLGKGGDPILTDPHVPFQIGKGFAMREGSDALVVSTGVTLQMALEAAEMAAARGVQVAVLHLPTVKPLDADLIREYGERAPVIVSVEEHSIIGGLGSAVAEVIAEAGFSSPKKFQRIGIPDVFPDQYGSQASLMARYGITAGQIDSVIHRLREEGANDGTIAQRGDPAA